MSSLGKVLASLLLAALACTRAVEQPPSPPPPAVSAAAAPEVAAPEGGILPPLETACAKNEDCAHAWTYEIDGQCCNGSCTPKPTTRAWVDKVETLCAKVGYSDRCPVKKCVPPKVVVCNAGKCVFGAEQLAP